MPRVAAPQEVSLDCLAVMAQGTVTQGGTVFALCIVSRLRHSPSSWETACSLVLKLQPGRQAFGLAPSQGPTQLPFGDGAPGHCRGALPRRVWSACPRKGPVHCLAL